MTAFICAFVTALIPILFWYWILIRKKRKSALFFFWIVLVFAMVFSYVWNIYIEESFLYFFHGILGAFFPFVCAGMLIEYGKNFIVRFIGHNFFHSLDDVVDLSFATALGFTFLSNILLFWELFSQSFNYESPVSIIKIVLEQEFFILPIHLFCSGIFGYYYGMALFALPEQRKKWGKLYSHIQIFKGTVISTLTYGLFFFVKEQDLRVRHITELFGYPNFPLDERLLPIISFGFFSAGTLFLFHKIEQHTFETETLEERKIREERES